MIKNLESNSDDSHSESGDSSSDSDNSDSSSSSNLNSNSDSKSDSSNNKSSSGSSSGSEAASSDVETHKEASLDLSHSSSSSNNGQSNKKYWDKNPDMYGVRRSARERKQPERMSLLEQTNKTKNKRKSNFQSSDESESDYASDSEPYNYQQRVKKKIPPQRKMLSQYNNYSENNRVRTSRNSGKVSYKEDSDSTAESEREEKGIVYDAAEDDQSTQTIDKVIRHRIGKRGAVGQQTYIYEVEKNGDPNINFDPENSSETEVQFLIKWKGWAHLHNTWESYESIKTQQVKGVKKIDNYMQREDDMNIMRLSCSPEEVEYASIQNEMEQELLASHLTAERVFAEAMENDIQFYYVKWANIPYADATWENEEIVMNRFQSQLAAFKVREESPCYPKPVSVLRHRPQFHALKQQPEYIGLDESYVLRDYQLDGLNWLIHAWCNHNSVILADEMGLGKTIQAISFMNYLFHEHDLYGPFLLVLPLSTINAWMREFAQWAPDMNVIVYIGDRTSRNIIHEFEWLSRGSRRIKFNAVLTTFEILLRDKDQLQELCDWTCLIVDEAHRLKNEESQLYQALMGFKSNYRLLITGTPLQNSLKELWALLHFIMPVKFNNCEEFESIKDKEHMKKGIHRLHKQLEPYLLRRVKKEVEKSLPAKVEQILRVDMTQLQKRYYKYILTRNYDKLRKGSLGSVSSFINIAMELKKCCNHSTLIRQEEEPAIRPNEYLQALLRGSGKLLLLDKLLVRLHETGHRVLVFSQMVMMLDILAYYMKLRRFQFQRLDGSISGELRRQALDHFNADGSTDFCFLLSTRAGGLGINLATADTVIIFDSDWNPQNDLQAQARAHRIGQKNQVNIYRLVTKNSIEETIIEKAKQKMVLDHLVIQSMDTSGRTVFNKKLNTSSTPFNKEELNAILKFGAEELFKEDVENEEEPVCDIDEILQRAETRDEGPSSAGDDLLSAFKVASFSLQEEPPKVDPATGQVKDWDDIIPEDIRNQAAEEEKQKEMAKLYLPPRKRNTVKNNDKSSPRGERSRRRRDSDFSEGDSDNMPRRRGRPRMHHKDGVKGFTDAEVRRFFKSFKKFSNPLRRLDTIADDASLRDKKMEDLKRLGEIIVGRCREILRDHEKMKASEQYNETANGGTKQRRDRPSFKLSGVAINARTTLAILDELEPLDHVVPHAPVQRASWTLQVKRVKDAHWDIPWGLPEDSRLLRGIYEFGIGAWEQIKCDASLNFGDKILLDSNVKPQAKHLENRAQYLLKLLKKTTTINKLNPVKIKIKRGKEQKSLSKEIIDDDSSDNSCDAKPTRHSTVKSSPKDDHLKMEVRTKVEPDLNDHKREHRSKHKKNKKDKKNNELDLVTTNGEHTPAGHAVKPNSSSLESEELDANHPFWSECKAKMRPMKKALKTLDDPTHCTNEDQLKSTRRCLLEIGNHIDNLVEIHYSHKNGDRDYKSLFWQFVAKFTEYEPKILYKLYRKHKNEKPEKEVFSKESEKKHKSSHKHRKRERKKSDDISQHHSAKRFRAEFSTERQSREKDGHSEDKNKNREKERTSNLSCSNTYEGQGSASHGYHKERDKDSHSQENREDGEWSVVSAGSVNYDGQTSGSHDYHRESRYPQDFQRDSSSSSYRQGSYPYHNESNYQDYGRGEGEWRNERSHRKNYSRSHTYSQSNYSNDRGNHYSHHSDGRSQQTGRSNYNQGHYGSRQTDFSHKKDGRGPPTSFQT